ncbi:hypothetical protein BH10ACT2_BH10ACT2_25250 [soil metagenome]
MPATTFSGQTNSASIAITVPRSRWIATLVFVVAMTATHLMHPDGWIGHYSYLAVSVAAGAVAWIAVAHRGGASRTWIAVGVSAAALGDVIYQIYVEIKHVDPLVSAADAAWIPSYISVGVAMMLILRNGTGRQRLAVQGLIDMAVIALAVSLLSWEFWLKAALSDGSVPLFARFVQAAYPLLDAVLLGLVIRGQANKSSRTVTSRFVGLGISFWLISDFCFMILDLSELTSSLLDVGWMIGTALLATACLVDDSEQSRNDMEDAIDNTGGWAIALAMTPLLVPGVIEVIGFLEGRDPNPIPLFAATVAFAGLATARALHILSTRNTARSNLTSSERVYRALAANSSDAVLMLDADGRILNHAPALAAMVGYPDVDTVGHLALDFVAPSDEAPQSLFHEVLLTPGVVLAGEARIRRPNDSELWLSTRAVNLLADPDVGGIVVNVHDITARKQSEVELLHQALHDSLTGLANRALFRDRVEHALSRRGRTGFDPAVIYLDLDGFKNVNDGLGHEAGDAVLKEVAARLRMVVRSGDTVARLGGDEFAILVEESGLVHVEAEAIAERVLQAMTAPIVLSDRDVTLSASLGIAHANSLATASTLLRDADVAMYQAKTAGKARWVVFESTMRAFAIERLQLETDMAHMIDNNELALVYQPLVELETSRIVGFEALVRWEHPVLGTISPDAFIPLAESNGSIVAIGEWVLLTACQTAAGWRDRHPGPRTMAVNLSARQLAAPQLIDQVQNALLTSGLDPTDLVLEMTETALVKDPEVAAEKLHQLRNLGVRLAIDDFGTGYSSLSYLRQFPFDILKIDRSFVEMIVDRDTVPPIVRGLLDLGRTMNLEMVAEGIESDAQLAQLRDQHCEFGQGFLFARPLQVEEAERLLEAFMPLAWQTPLTVLT